MSACDGQSGCGNRTLVSNMDVQASLLCKLLQLYCSVHVNMQQSLSHDNKALSQNRPSFGLF